MSNRCLCEGQGEANSGKLVEKENYLEGLPRAGLVLLNLLLAFGTIGLDAKGNPGVASLIKQLPGSIGYAELIYALQNNMPVGAAKNVSGKFREPAIESVSLAAQGYSHGLVSLPEQIDASGD